NCFSGVASQRPGMKSSVSIEPVLGPWMLTKISSALSDWRGLIWKTQD
ncbi:MAG: hypothetical protein ACI8PT_004924, partial [Gammaproteobacteria bacterium]